MTIKSDVWSGCFYCPFTGREKKNIVFQSNIINMKMSHIFDRWFISVVMAMARDEHKCMYIVYSVV